MIATLGGASPRSVHIDGVPIVAETARTLHLAALSIPLSDRDGWMRLAHSLRGQFAIVVAEGPRAVAITDLTGCYPVFRLAAPNGETAKLATSLAELEEHSRRTIRRSALCQYVAFGAMDLNGETIYSDIDRAAGGSVIFYEPRRIETREYAGWEAMSSSRLEDADAAEDRIEQVVRSYTSANMIDLPPSEPLGILLSGGTDSTLLTALLRADWRGRFNCFTQQFRFKRYSEFDQAAENARALNVTAEPVMLGRRTHLEAVLALNSPAQDQPCVTMQAFNLWSMAHVLARRCRRLTVGEHADSLFLGFGHFFHGLPSETEAYTAAAAALSDERKLAWVIPQTGVSALDAELLSVLAVPKNEYAEWLHEFARTKRAKLGRFAGLHLTTLQQLDGQIEGGLSWQRIALPVQRSLSGVRVLTPFFDRAMIAVALSLPPSLKYRDGKTKYLLRQMLRKYIGRDLTKKPAAASPVAIWRLLPSIRERAAISPSIRPYYDALMRRNTFALGRVVNHYVKVAALGVWMAGRRL